MTVFIYKAIDENGKKTKGKILSSSEEGVRANLEKQGYLLLDLKEKKQKKAKARISKKDVYFFTKELAKLLKAGLPLYEALEVLKDKYQKHRWYLVVVDIADQVQRGSSFSKAIGSYPNIFDYLYRSMIQNAEHSSTLIETLEEIELFLAHHLKLKKQVIDALLYPMILVSFGIAILSGLIFFVIPSLMELFEGRSLHPLTQFVLNISAAVHNHSVIILLSIIFLAAAGIYLFYSKRGKTVLYSIMIQLTFIEKLLKKIDLVRFCRSFSSLLKGGVTFVKALQLSQTVVRHPLMKKELFLCCEEVEKGNLLSENLRKKKHIPLLVSRMLAIAEEGGGTENMLSQVAEIYEDELERLFAQISTMAQPILLLIIGGFVGLIVLSVLLPLTDVSSFISD